MAELEAEVAHFKASYARKIDEVDALLRQVAELEQLQRRSEINGAARDAHLKKLEDELAALRAATQWWPIAEAPKDGQEFLLGRAADGHWFKGSWWLNRWVDDCFRTVDQEAIPLITINNKVDAPSQWLASARRDFPQLSYQEAQ